MTRRTSRDDQARELEHVGIDPKRLSAAFAEVDEQGDGELELFEFREFWGMVFPERPMTEATWKYTERMFREIDADCSNRISFEEIISFLNKSLDVERELSRRPETLFDWCRVLTTDCALAWLKPGDAVLSFFIYSVRILEHIMILLASVVLMVNTLPEMQSNRDGDDLRGTRATFVLESIAVSYFVVHLIAWATGYVGASLPDGTPDYTEASQAASPIATKKGAPPPETTMDRVGDLLVSGGLWLNLMSIVPYFVRLGDPSFYHLLPLQSFRMVRLLRVLKFINISGTQKAPDLGPALLKSVMSLWFLFLLILISMCLSASFMYFAESTDQATFNYTMQKWVRDSNSIYIDAGTATAFQSIPDSLWWSVVTLTTVGYGDTFPTTIGGKIVATLTMLGGLIVVGYPITILTGTFQSMEEERVEREERLERNRELYNGIREWLANAELEINSVHSPDVFNVVDHKGGMVSTTTKKRKDVVEDALHTMSLRLTDRLSSLSDRVAKLEAKQKKKNNKSTYYLKSMRRPAPHAAESSVSGSLNVPGGVQQALAADSEKPAGQACDKSVRISEHPVADVVGTAASNEGDTEPFVDPEREVTRPDEGL
eukprot:TRINITY_DN28089_c0_g2_i1.p1 TRINITY_DN28089_c0_g2~~TRINITY_DN28089_c0_g2_i1.p1  ORF type:complete len:602 (+),score=176.59 TRINITY_DN28089_c0_g2_i1:81-1886(+)